MNGAHVYSGALCTGCRRSGRAAQWRSLRQGGTPASYSVKAPKSGVMGANIWRGCHQRFIPYFDKTELKCFGRVFCQPSLWGDGRCDVGSMPGFRPQRWSPGLEGIALLFKKAGHEELHDNPLFGWCATKFFVMPLRALIYPLTANQDAVGALCKFWLFHLLCISILPFSSKALKSTFKCGPTSFKVNRCDLSWGLGMFCGGVLLVSARPL